MPRYAEVRGQTLEFPDSFTDEQIDAIVQRDFFNVSNQARQNMERIKAETPEEKTFLGGLRDAVIPSREALGEIGQMVNVTDPVGQIKAYGRMGKGLWDAQMNQANEAKSSFREGNYLEAAGHMAGAYLPVIGPAAAEAGEDIKGGDIGYGLGKAVGLVGTALTPGGVKARNAAKVKNAPKIIAKAEADYAGLFGKSAKNAEIAEKVTPGMMDRGVKFTNPRGDLAELAETKATAADKAVDAAIDSMPEPVSLNKVLDRTTASKDKALTPYGPDSQAIYEKIDDYERNVLPQNADAAGNIEPQTARELRRLFDQKPAARGAYSGADNLTPDVQAREAVGNALRGELNTDAAVAAANAEESFWLNVKRIAEAAPEGKGMAAIVADNAKMAGAGALAGAAAAAIGMPALGAIGGAPVMYAVYRTIRDIPRTPAWRSASAIRRRNFGKALQSGNYGKAAEIGAEIAAGGLIADEQ
jgi:hypothetical protein